MNRARTTPKTTKPLPRPAVTPEGRENQLISLAVDEAERLMRDHIAPAQVLVHFLKLATGREKLERQKIQNENLLLSAKVQQISDAARVEGLMIEAIEAMRKYSGNFVEEDYDG